MRILLITEGLGSGGAERQICGLAAMLTERGYECILITYAPDKFYEEYLHAHHVDYEYVPILLHKKNRVIRLVRYLYKYKPTTIISFLPSVNIACCLARIFYRCNLIVSERNCNIGISLRDKITFNLYRLADYVIPNSYSQSVFIRKHFPFLSKKVKTIVNFVDLNKFVPIEEKNRNDIFRIITVARYGEQKNVLAYLDMVSKIKDIGLQIHFDWYGNKHYDEDYYAMVERKLKELGLEGYLTLHDATQDIVEKYQQADAFLLPSLYEGYPNVIIEAMCCELPILCSRVFDNPKIVKEGENGFLFNPYNVDEMANSIVKVSNLSLEERVIIGKRNREKCIVNNTQNRFVNEYLTLLQ